MSDRGKNHSAEESSTRREFLGKTAFGSILTTLAGGTGSSAFVDSAAGTDSGSLLHSTLTNSSECPAFFMRAELTKGPEGEEVLLIIYEDNYVTLFPHEAQTLQARFRQARFRTEHLAGEKPYLRLKGWNVAKRTVAMNLAVR